MIDLLSVQGSLGRKGGKAPGAEGKNMDHLCLRVQPFDEEAILAFLAASGVKHTPEVHNNFGAEGDGPSVYFTDPDGNEIELKGPAITKAGQPGFPLSGELKKSKFSCRLNCTQVK